MNPTLKPAHLSTHTSHAAHLSTLKPGIYKTFGFNLTHHPPIPPPAHPSIPLKRVKTLVFIRSQYSLFHVLSENFVTHEKQIIADHDRVQLVEKIKKYSDTWNTKLELFPDKPGWTPTHWMTKWLPFGYMYMRSIAAKYDNSGVTDTITKCNASVSSKTFTPSDITKWVSTIDHAWAGWRNTVTDPDHMAAVEFVREILSSDNKDWKTWAFSFANTQADKPYTVADLLEKVVCR